MKNIEDNAAQMCRLAEAGVSFACDDFGTGRSSLSYLHRLPVRKLKVDRSFIRELMHPQGTGRITTGIISLAHRLESCVVAEGVENEHQSREFPAQGYDLFQGYLLPRPLEEGQVTDIVMSVACGQLLNKHAAGGVNVTNG